MTCLLQFYSEINWRTRDNEVSRRMWKAVETKAGKTGMAETERKREKEKKQEKME